MSASEKNRYIHTHTHKSTHVLVNVFNMSTTYSVRQTTTTSLPQIGLFWLERRFSCPWHIVFSMWGVTCVEWLSPSCFVSY